MPPASAAAAAAAARMAKDGGGKNGVAGAGSKADAKGKQLQQTADAVSAGEHRLPLKCLEQFQSIAPCKAWTEDK